MLELFDIDTSSLIAAFVFGVIGYWMFRESRRRDNTKVKYIGVALMIYPYFVDGAIKNWATGIILCGAAYYYWWK